MEWGGPCQVYLMGGSNGWSGGAMSSGPNEGVMGWAMSSRPNGGGVGYVK